MPDTKNLIRRVLSRKGTEKTVTIPKKVSDMEHKFRLHVTSTPPKRYSVMKDYRSVGLNKLAPNVADEVSRSYIERATKTMTANKVVPGQLISFNYFTPKTMDQLEYYDAKPVTIFFCVFNSKEGKRILGFNIHYYPPKMRVKIMDKIYSIYRAVYSKYFDSPLPTGVDGFAYRALIDALKKAKLEFGVREYIPSLCHQVRQVPPNLWKIALYTEGVFKKQTREAILKHWKDYRQNR